MTEAEWLAATDPTPMLEFLQGKASDRKLRLWACACHLQQDGPFQVVVQEAVAVAERWADEGQPAVLPGHVVLNYVCDKSAWVAAFDGTALYLKGLLGSGLPEEDLFRLSLKYQLDTLHDIFGNPFRPVTVSPSWLTSTVVALAEGIYADRAYDRLPILADALQDAGCENPDVLEHCRGDGPHVRGCWVVDLVLGKS